MKIGAFRYQSLLLLFDDEFDEKKIFIQCSSYQKGKQGSGNEFLYVGQLVIKWYLHDSIYLHF